MPAMLFALSGQSRRRASRVTKSLAVNEERRGQQKASRATKSVAGKARSYKSGQTFASNAACAEYAASPSAGDSLRYSPLASSSQALQLSSR